MLEALLVWLALVVAFGVGLRLGRSSTPRLDQDETARYFAALKRLQQRRDAAPWN